MECKICHKDFKNLNGLSVHITKTHKYISQQEYYDKYLRPENYKNICPTCGKLTEFISIGYGYKTHCNRFCSNKDLSIIQQRHDTINTLYGGHALCFKETQDKCKQTTLQRYGVNNAYQINSIKEKAHSTQAVEKHYQTMKQNKTFKTSKQGGGSLKEIINQLNIHLDVIFIFHSLIVMLNVIFIGHMVVIGIMKMMHKIN